MYKYIETGISELKLIELNVFCDERGELIKPFDRVSFQQVGIPFCIEEVVISISKLGSIRGLHLQTNNPQAKIVNVLKGRIFDVVVDLRQNSETYSKIFCVEFTSNDRRILYIPEGFAHGFLALENDTIVSYPCSNRFDSDSEVGINYNDPDLNIPWPRLEVEYIVSHKDQNLMAFRDYNDSKKRS